MARVIGAERRQRARALGAAVRLGCDLSGRNPRLLEKSGLAIKGERLALTAARRLGRHAAGRADHQARPDPGLGI